MPFLGRLTKRLTDWPLCALALLILGVFVTEEEANTRRLGLRYNTARTTGLLCGSSPLADVSFASSTAKGKPRAKDARVRRGDVVVCNHTSFLEVLVLAKRFSPEFVFASEESASKGLVRVCGLPGAVFRSFAAPLGAIGSSVRPLVVHGNMLA